MKLRGQLGVIDVWLAAVRTRNVQALRALLSSDEHARLGRLTSAVDRARFTAAHGALRLVLGEYLGVDAASLWFCRGPRGKPFLDKPAISNFGFSLSHCGDLVAIAVNLWGTVGIDIEERSTCLPGAGWTEGSCQYESQRSSHLRSCSLVQRWVCAEARGKALGSGLDDTIEFASGSGQRLVSPQPHREGVEGGVVRVRELDLGSGWCGAIASESVQAGLTIRAFEVLTPGRIASVSYTASWLDRVCPTRDAILTGFGAIE